jgi:hypothetical protein
MLETIIVRASASAIRGHRQELLTIKLSRKQGSKEASYPSTHCVKTLESCLLICCPHATANFSPERKHVAAIFRSRPRNSLAPVADVPEDRQHISMAWHDVAWTRITQTR